MAKKTLTLQIKPTADALQEFRDTLTKVAAGRRVQRREGVYFTSIEAARNLLYKACMLKDQKKPFGKEAAMAKLYCSEVMGRVVDEAVQLHGGYGLMKEYNIERFYRDYKLLTIGEGTSEVQRIVISRKIGCYDV